MPLSAGTRLGPYEILSAAGAGGMGEVYRARDTRLDRIVAIKVLSPEISARPDVIERFEREARAVSALSHPNICTLYDVGTEYGTPYLVMEYLEGETLAQRLARGPIAFEDALLIAAQIGDALDQAHRRGIVHRDLKPANLMLIGGKNSTTVKLLDFGLAKAAPQRAAAGAGATSLPTVSQSLTMEGTIVGTFQYMAPEQLEGREADPRTDIFAFGTVLYEMTTGRRAFDGKTQASLIGAIMHAEPPAIPARPALDRLIRRCLAKDPDDRWQTARDITPQLRWMLENPETAPPAGTPARSKMRERIAWATAAVCAAALFFGFLILRRQQPPPPPIQFTVDIPENGVMPAVRPSVSPNGEYIMFAANPPGSATRRLYLYSLSSGTTRAVPGADSVTAAAYWSFDSRSLLISRDGGFSVMDLNGGVHPLPFTGSYASWGPDGVVADTREGLQLFRPEAASSRLILAPDQKKEKVALAYLCPTLIPGGRWFIYNAMPLGTSTTVPISVRMASLDGGEERQILTVERAAVFAEPGYLLYLRGDTLTAQAFDRSSGKLRGDPAPVASPVNRNVSTSEPGSFSTSQNGVLVFNRAGAIGQASLVWFDRSGKRLGTLGEVADYSNPALSPDETRLAVAIRDPSNGRRGIWIFDLAHEAGTRLTFDPADDLNPMWSPDGTRIAFSSDRRGSRDLYAKNASGTGADELLLQSPLSKNLEDWSRDGRFIVYNQNTPNAGNDILVLPLDSRTPQDFLRTRFTEDHAQFSSDGKWLAYQSDESGRSEVYIQTFPATAGKWQISTGGGGEPHWRGDGKELYYTTLQDPARVMAVDIGMENGAIKAGIPHTLFEVRLPAGVLRNKFLAARDGKKFLAIVPSDQTPINSFTVILNWPSLLRKR